MCHIASGDYQVQIYIVQILLNLFFVPTHIESMPRKETFKPEPPKKPMCAFFLYRMDIYPRVKQQFAGYKITEITRQIGEMWKVQNPATKEFYEKKAAKEKERVQREREQYQSMYGKPESKRKRRRRIKREYEQVKRYLNSRDTVTE